jgi:phosphoglycerate dehydrogenase-like enzyme
MPTTIAVAPKASSLVVDAVRTGGGTVVDVTDEPDALVWMDSRDSDGLRDALAAAPTARWVQLPFAGVENFLRAGVLTPDRTWTCAKGVYAEPTAEHALALALAGLRHLPAHARTSSWGSQGGATLYDAPVVILGGGGITSALLGLLSPFRARTTVVRRSPEPLPGADRTVGIEQLDQVLPDALVVVLALALTPETEHIIGPEQLTAMGESAWLVNIARGRHIDTDALVQALTEHSIGGAALDVTDPEPLPDGHPLWSLPNCLITPHTANPWQIAQPLLAVRITENVRRFHERKELLGLVDLDAGY